ncbi:MAG TPA: D-tyrosyl-tRNA(Tyr) deacylase [Firmicutes bacterium]|nr:D-tyrosyl-tRNA(Tyr) deacylase [Bacillota bacterium]
MRAIVQRINSCVLSVDGKEVSRCGFGYLVLLGFTQGDTREKADYIVNRIVNMRIFRDGEGKLNLSLKEVGGQVMAVSNFTLYANPATGRRPDFSSALNHAEAKPLYDYTVNKFKELLGNVAQGAFGEHMHLETNLDGPVTVVFEK